jgi:hypothetical protein
MDNESEVSNKNENLMAYSNFTLRQVEKDFHLQIEEKIDLFAHVKAIAPSDDIKKILAENIPLALDGDSREIMKID